MTTTTHPKGAERAAKITESVNGMMSDYRLFYDRLVPEARDRVVRPDRVEQAIRQHIAKTGRVRFKKGKPPKMVETPEGRVHNEAFLFWLFREHTGFGAYRSIDGLMMARWRFGAELCDVWERTVDAMHHMSSDHTVSRVAEVYNEVAQARAEGAQS